METSPYATNLSNQVKALLGIRGKLDFISSLTESRRLTEWPDGMLQRIKYTLYSMPHLFNMSGDTGIFFVTGQTKDAIYAMTKLESLPDCAAEDNVAIVKDIYKNIKVLDRDIKLLNIMLYITIVAIYSARKDLLTLCYYTVYLLRKEI